MGTPKSTKICKNLHENSGSKVLMQLDRPGAADNDCTAALALNPDSAKAYKMRARLSSEALRTERIRTRETGYLR